MADVDTATPTADNPTPEQEVTALLANVDEATARTALLDELLDIVEYMKPVDAKNKRRIRLYQMLVAPPFGMSNKEIADYLGVTAESVRQALLKARRGRDGR